MKCKVELEGLEIRIVESYSTSDQLSLSGGAADPWQTHSYRLQYRPKEQHVLILERGRMVCHTGLLKHAVDVGGGPVPVAGIGGVLTGPEFRGRGLARIALQRAEEFAQSTMGLNFGLLFCRQAMQEWYARMAWAPVTEPVWIEQPQGTIQSPLAVMVKQFGAQSWPPGAVRLGCLPW